jgi:hypothetical protein
MARAEHRERDPIVMPPTAERNAGSAVALEAAMKFFAMMTDSVKFCRFVLRL